MDTLFKYYLKINLSLIVLLFNNSFCFSQNTDSFVVTEKSSNLKLSYNSSLIYPGARIGIDIPILKTYLTKTKKSGKIWTFDKDRFISANLSWYHHSTFHDNFYLTSGWTMRRTKPTGFFREFSPEIGYSRTFLGGTTYKVDNNGNVSIEKLAGYNYALLSLGGGVGYDFSKTKSIPLLIFYKLNMLAMYPYNSTIYLRPAMELGLIYIPAKFLPTKVKIKRKVK